MDKRIYGYEFSFVDLETKLLWIVEQFERKNKKKTRNEQNLQDW